ncbi:hypothetical protein D3C87_2095050 [compost metagenome]
MRAQKLAPRGLQHFPAALDFDKGRLVRGAGVQPAPEPVGIDLLDFGRGEQAQPHPGLLLQRCG